MSKVEAVVARIIVGCLVLAAIILAFKLWIDAHDERIRLHAEIAALKEQDKRDQAEGKAKEAAQNAKAEAARKNPAAMGDFIASQVPFKIEQIPNQVPGEISPPEIHIASAETPKFLEYANRCSVCEIKLATAEKRIANLEEQNRKLEKVGKPGFWRRVGNCALRGGIGAAPGGIKGDGTQAGVGAGIGIATCFIWRN